MSNQPTVIISQGLGAEELERLVRSVFNGTKETEQPKQMIDKTYLGISRFDMPEFTANGVLPSFSTSQEVQKLLPPAKNHLASTSELETTETTETTAIFGWGFRNGLNKNQQAPTDADMMAFLTGRKKGRQKGRGAAGYDITSTKTMKAVVGKIARSNGRIKCSDLEDFIARTCPGTEDPKNRMYKLVSHINKRMTQFATSPTSHNRRVVLITCNNRNRNSMYYMSPNIVDVANRLGYRIFDW